jgi:hypothetical protein
MQWKNVTHKILCNYIRYKIHEIMQLSHKYMYSTTQYIQQKKCKKKCCQNISLIVIIAYTNNFIWNI